MLLYIHRDQKLYYGQGAHLDFHTVPELQERVSMLLYIHRDHKDYYGQGAQDGHLDFHTAPELQEREFQCCFTSTETKQTIMDREPT